MALKVLVADDEPEVLEIMAKAVALRGYAVVQASDGQEAWEKIKKENPDIILLDLIMPGMHGMTILKKLREDPLPDRVQPVILISSLGELEDVQKGFSHRADHYITKPCAIDTVLRAVEMMHELIEKKSSGQGRI